ncbi:MAG TPA: vWA domain-containing protein [Actinomycetota bacterium]|nr:vWA domain-containing protein [Actinomycetota bacterium]
MRTIRSITQPLFGAIVVAATLALPAVPAYAAHRGCDDPPSPPRTRTARAEPARLEPAPAPVTLANGAAHRIEMRLVRPADPTPVDVFFLIDTTGSMAGAICGVQRDLSSVAVELAESGVDVRFGLGIYRDYPFSPWGSPGDFAYRRVRDLAPLDRELLEALHNLEAAGGGDGLQSGLAALYQVATGEGQDVNPAGRSAGDIEPGIAPRFRKDSLRLVINATDVEFREPREEEKSNDYGDYPGPAFDRAVSVLRTRAIMQAGIAISSNAAGSLGRMASKTGAVAPPGGADCDGDGRADLRAGAPLVCEGQEDSLAGPLVGGQRPVKMANAIVAIVRALRDEATIGFTVEGGDGLLQAVTPRTSPAVDLKRDATLPVSVDVRCDRVHGRKTLRIAATLRGEVIASVPYEVTCLPPPSVVRGVQRAAAHAPSAQQPAQQPASQPQTNPNPNPNTNVQAQADPSAAVGVAVAPQPQGALARAFEQTDGLAGMTARRRSTRPYAAGVLLVTITAAGCAAFARRPAPATAASRAARPARRRP